MAKIQWERFKGWRGVLLTLAILCDLGAFVLIFFAEHNFAWILIVLGVLLSFIASPELRTKARDAGAQFRAFLRVRFRG